MLQSQQIVVLSLIIGLVFAGIIAYLIYAQPSQQIVQPEGEDEGVFCTLDARICPDGSYVGRIPPDCEFAACPGE